jgi:hypothetical protein
VLGSRDPIKTISKYLSIVQSIYFALKYFVTFKIYYGHAAVANSQIKNWDLHEKQMGGYSQRMSAPPNTTGTKCWELFLVPFDKNNCFLLTYCKTIENKISCKTESRKWFQHEYYIFLYLQYTNKGAQPPDPPSTIPLF